MKLSRIYLEDIKHFSQPIQERLIREAPHTRISGPVPDELSFLAGPGLFVDLGFEDLGLKATGEDVFIYRAFSGTGIVIPGTTWRLRYTRAPFTVVEPLDGTETATLPIYWLETVLVLGPNDQVTWLGKRVNEKRRSGFDLTGYVDVGPALVPPEPA